MKTKERLLFIWLCIIKIVPVLPMFCIILIIALSFPIWVALWAFTGFNLFGLMWYTMEWLINYEFGDKFEFDEDWGI